MPSRQRMPQQARGRRRVEGILRAAAEQLARGGFEAFSITALADDLDCTRAAIYKFFPTPDAIFEALTRRELDHLESTLVTAAEALPPEGWEAQIEQMVEIASAFHNAHPVARLLILGAPHGETSYRSLELTIARLGELTRRVMAAHAISLPRQPADSAMLAVEIGTACLRTGFFLQGEISSAYRAEAARAMIAYLRALPPAP